MADYIQDLRGLIAALRSLRTTAPCDADELEMEGKLLITLRKLWASIPNSRLKEPQRADYIEKIIGTTPTEEHLNLGVAVKRTRRISLTERISLEEKQGGRCALCGTFLDLDSEPHIDHIMPISLGGKDELSNFQILCRACNLGKGNSLHWITLSPFFDERPGNDPSASLRYAVLQRHGGSCGIPNCEMNSTTGRLSVVPKIPVSEGGRIIFDNLTVLCEHHREINQNEQYQRARNQMRGKIGGGFSFG